MLIIIIIHCPRAKPMGFIYYFYDSWNLSYRLHFLHFVRKMFRKTAKKESEKER